MKIKSNISDYEVIFEKDFSFLQEMVHTANTQYVIDANVYRIYQKYFIEIPHDRLMLIEANETNKVIETALSICEKITELSAKRNARLVSIGGGIIQDITGFVANITYRGIQWIYIPTTLLSACDSCIGGKTSLNYKKYKNLLGTFFPPKEIHICSDFFKTLTQKDFESGLGEVVKFNIMVGQSGLHHIEQNIELLLSRDSHTIDQFVHTSLEFKKSFIEMDEFDRGERVKLNFAHTFGHAIEVISNYEIPHGTAVAIGMIMADYVSYKRSYLDESIVTRAENVLQKVIHIDSHLLEVDLQDYINAMRKDKKQISEDLTAVLISDYSNHAELSIVHDLKTEEVETAIQHFLRVYKCSEEVS